MSAHKIQELPVGDVVRRLPQGRAGCVLAYEEDAGLVSVQWPHIADPMTEYECDLERLTTPCDGQTLPVLETWQSDEYAPSPNVVWEVLGKWQNLDLEMWTCRIATPDMPEGCLGDCYAAYVRWDAVQVFMR